VKLLFLTHDASMYGAARSLGTLLKAYHGVERHLVLSRHAGTFTDAQMRDRFGPDVVFCGRRTLPFSPCYRGAPSLSELDVLRHAAWMLERPRLYRWLDRSGYDAIHLNSLTLHPVVRDDFPFLVHVREIATDGAVRRAARSLERAAGVVFIDAATQEPFAGARLRRSIVLNNPFDMRGVASSADVGLEERIGARARDVVVYAMLGVLRPEKGIEFAIEAFRRSVRRDVRLLIVGWGSSESAARARAVAGGDPRVVLWGEEGRIDSLYAAIDYVVRAEPYACIGRTIYEGLFAGSGVVIPGGGSDRAVFVDRERFAARIHEYPPRDGPAFTALVDSLPKVSRGEPASNVDSYVAGFDAFVRGLGGPAR